MITLTGKLIGVGNIERFGAICGRGLALEVTGETVALLGLSADECRTLATHIGERIQIGVSTCARGKIPAGRDISR